ncbi:uncharacterized protein CANTADRAFT_87518 [Suhomyces tanzawaensis NRRL Y-17324]|uniref:Regulator of phospholipase D SRF1 n=1 Tax=Suhomyces tanzawaensis NRRL Y-17324 TaxID=984487 RepID=A0A1E4SPU0_9ASCO|nr:uncharacterized protein CANTADRAFT_87518 [Suhomyces tanzawaensis NRRL Y-17324]ODV81534.1 hypothetical protein CANTADRAFT_87518 [Suhomyces tanzawaensis NRRL Y-17324]
MSDTAGLVKVNPYNHRPNIVPPYVLDTLSQAHYKDQLVNTNNNVQGSGNPLLKTSQLKINDEEQFLSFANDPYVSSVNNNWSSFLKSVQQPTAYTDDRVKVEQDFDPDRKLNGTWEGDDRLRLALLGTSSMDEDTYVGDESRGLFSWMWWKKKPKKLKDDAPRVRSKAGYWMSDEKRADVFPTLKRIFVQNPLVPLFMRIMILVFSVAALALAVSIFVFSRRQYDDSTVQQQPSTIMAVVVQCCAIAYIIYIAYDEYSGKPLGLRDPLGKMKLIMLDLLFIIFSSANLSLTFNTLYDHEWVCRKDDELISVGIFSPTVSSICRRQRALASFLFLVLCMWVLTFTISIIRVVDRVNVVDPRNK